MGILGVLCYGTFFVGSLAFMAFSIYAFQAGKPGDRASGYYLGRLSFYSLLLIIVGLAQLMLGSYVLSNFGSGPLPNGAISVAMFVVYFPEISVFVGLVYVLNGLFGLGRYFSVLPSSPDNHTFQFSIGFQYLCTLVLMIITQFSLSPGAGYAAAAPSVACLTLGAHVLPAFLDYKARTTPDVLSSAYFGIAPTEKDLTPNEDTDHEMLNDSTA